MAEGMRAVIDARSALDPFGTGIGHYASRIVRHLPLADPDSSYIAWHLDPKGIRRGAFLGVAPNLIEAAGRFPARWFDPVSSRLGFPRADSSAGQFDVLLATNFLPPATRCRAVVLVVHDLAFDVLPDTAPHVDARWRRRFQTWLERAAGIVVPSTCTRDDLNRSHGIDPARVEVVHHGAEQGFVPAPEPVVADVRRRLGLGDEPYLLFVGGIEPRKNLEALVRAFGLVATSDPSPRLVIAGGPVRWFPGGGQRLDAAVAALPASVRTRVIRTGRVGEEDKTALLTGARLLAYPSLYEGFGFPILEAFAAGVPVLASDVSSLPEIAGDAALLVDPRDEGAIARGIDRLLHDSAVRERSVAAGRRRLTSFTWQACASRTAAVMHRALAQTRT